MKSVGIALSGGGARGIVHIGILKALHEEGIQISMVTGTSAGAIVGLFYCSGFSPDNIMEIVCQTKLIRYMRPAARFSGLLKLDALIPVFQRYLSVDLFEALSIPLVVSATNLEKGENELIGKGELIRAVLASCAVPVLFEPVKLNGTRYMDGGILNNLPVEPLIDRCDLVLGSDCNPVDSEFQGGNVRSLVERSLLMAVGANTKARKRWCHFVFEPEMMKGFGAFEFSKSEEIFAIGYDYGKSVANQIRQLL